MASYNTTAHDVVTLIISHKVNTFSRHIQNMYTRVCITYMFKANMIVETQYNIP